MIQITCKVNSAICTRTERLTSGMVGLQCEFVFDGAWDGLAKMAVFTAGNEKRDVLLTGAICKVPWEVLQHPGYQLVIGVYGTNADGTLVIPTCYAMCGGIGPGADPSGDEGVDPTLPVWGQMQGMIGDLGNLATSSKDNLVAAINEAAKSGSGGGTDDHSKLINRNVADQHPMSAITGLVGALDGKVSVADIIDDLTTNAANKPLSAAQGVALKALIDAIRIPEKLPNPAALTFTGAVSGTYDGSAPLEVVIPSGGGGASDMTLLAEVDCSQVSGNIELTGLNDLTEIYITSDAVQSSHESTNSGYYIEINGVYITKNEFVPIYKSGYTAYTWGLIYYNGCVWVPIKSAEAKSKSNYGLSNTNINAPYNLIEGVGKAKKLRLGAPVNQYIAVSGTIKIYGR